MFTHSFTRTLDELRSVKHLSILLVTGRSFLKKRGLLEAFKVCLEENNTVFLYDKIPPEFSDASILAGVKICKKNGVNTIIAIGGGSAIDAGKLISLLATNEQAAAYYLKHEPSVDPLPLISIPTTSGSGSEMTKYCVYTDTSLDRKVTIKYDKLIPQKVFYDIDLMMTMPLAITIESAYDAFVHNFEVFTQKGIDKATKKEALCGIKLFFQNVQFAEKNLNNQDFRKKMAKASYYGGVVINKYRTGLIHTIANHLGYALHVSHGKALAAVFIAVYNYNRKFWAEDIRIICSECECNQATFLETISKVIISMGIQGGLDSLGLTEPIFATICERVLADKDLSDVNPTLVTYELLEEILERNTGGVGIVI